MPARRALAALLLGGALAAAPAFQPAPEEERFSQLLDRDHHPVEAREAAKAYLAGHPGSWMACEVIGMVYLNTDGDLPKALYWFQRARTLLEDRYGPLWGPGTPEGNYSATLGFLADTQYRMERYEDGLRTLAARDRLFSRQHPSSYAWPLMKLGRAPEARRKIAEALASGNRFEVASALNTQASLEAEADLPEAAFATQMKAYEYERSSGGNRDVSIIRNAGNGAWVLGQSARAEALFLEGTEQFNAYTVSNPWGDLASLYLQEQRFSEAMDAVKQMQLWAFHSKPLMAETHWNTRQTLTGALLLYCGCTEEALVIARRLTERPDRHATGSARGDQREAATQLFHFQVLEDALARSEEEASYAPWKRRPALLLRRARLALESALARRRAGSMLMEYPERLAHSMRVLAPQSIVDITGGEALLPRIAGPGVAEAEIRRLLPRATPAALRERGFLFFALGAARMERGDARGALAALDQADPLIPAEFGVMRTQSQALRAKALMDLGDASGALAPLEAVLQRDGGELRRMGMRLPCGLQASGPLAQRAAGLLKGSPRLAPGRGGFRVVVEQGPDGSLRGGLDSPRGTILCRFQVPRQADPDDQAREFCRQFHRKVFGPRIDLSQQQIRSLEGSTLASQGAEEQLKGILGN